MIWLMTRTLTGGCQCGKVRYTAQGEPVNVRVCHCRTCQRITGSAFFARALFPAGAVEVVGETSGYATSPDLVRHFCPTCGSTVFAARPDGVALALGTLDEPDALEPEVHVFASRRMRWLPPDDDRPSHDEYAPA